MQRHRCAVVRLNRRLVEFVSGRLSFDEQSANTLWSVDLEGITDGRQIIDAMRRGTSLQVDVTTGDGSAFNGEATVSDVHIPIKERYFCDAKLTGSGPLRSV